MSLTVAPKAPEALTATDKLVLLLLFAAGLTVRLMEASLLSFPALDDPAFHLKVAENLASGRGMTIAAIWNYQVPFSQIEHPSNEHWMPLTSLVLAPLFAFFGSSLQVAQVAGAFFGSLLVPLTWVMAREALSSSGRPWRGLALFSTALVAFNPLLVYQSVTVDSAVYFGLCALLAVWLAASRLERGPGYAVLTGVVGGLAFLARSDGLLLLGVLLVWAWRGTAELRWRRVLPLLLGMGVIVTPWLTRNALTFGSPFPSSALVLALLPDYPTLFHYGQPSYWEGLTPPAMGTLAALRLQGLGHNLYVLLIQALFPLAPFALVGVWALMRAPLMALGLSYGGLLFITTALLFPVPTMYGTFYHDLGAVIPFLAIAAALGLQQSGRLIGTRLFEDPYFMPVLISIAVLLLVLAQLVLSALAARDLHKRWEGEFSLASQWLSARGAGTVLTTQPYSLHYASGLPSVMLPVSDSPATVRAVAQRYNAGYVVGFGSFGRYPQVLREDSPSGFTLAFESDGLWIYEVK